MSFGKQTLTLEEQLEHALSQEDGILAHIPIDVVIVDAMVGRAPATRFLTAVRPHIRQGTQKLLVRVLRGVVKLYDNAPRTYLSGPAGFPIMVGP